jgi:phosphoserine phosphatase RsbX
VLEPLIAIELASAQRPAMGETVSGDAFVSVARAPMLYVGLADGLGHGPLAAEPALRFCRSLQESVPADPIELMRAATQSLKDTRGAVGAVLRIDRATRKLVFSGVGNIALRARSKEPIAPVCSPGILGRRTTRLSTYSYEVHVGDVIVVHTDGISARFDDKLLGVADTKRIAELLLSEHGKSHDDATCIVLRVTSVR